MLLETLNNQQRTTIRAMEEQQAVTMKSHEALHQEVRNMADRHTGTAAFTGRIDKTLLPNKYAGSKDSWRMFSSKFINCLGKAYPSLTPALQSEMGKANH